MDRLFNRSVMRYQSLMGDSGSDYGATCVITDASPTYVVAVAPQTARDIARLAGCGVDDLPEEIRQWAKDRTHRGNHLLDRLDPMDWAIDDPWSKESFALRIYLSKRGLSRLEGMAKR